MYRIITAFGLIVMVVTCCAVSLVIQSNIYGEIEQKFIEIETAYNEEEFEKCDQLSEELIEFYDSNTNVLLFFSKHKGIEDLMESIKKLPYYIDVSPAIFKSQLEVCQGNLEVLQYQDIPNFVNIF